MILKHIPALLSRIPCDYEENLTIPSLSWQEETLLRLSDILQSDPDVLGLVLTGSLAQEAAVPDDWSDLDVLVVVRDAAITRYYPSIAWLGRLGDLWAWEQPQGGHVTLARFSDFRRVDLVFHLESELEQVGEWGARPLWAGHRQIFSRSDALDTALARPFERSSYEPVPSDQFETMAARFRFACGVAVYKVVRGDLLIAAHLALELVQDCLVLGMMLRDRDLGRTHHREGGAYGHLLEQAPSLPRPYDALSILETVEQAATLFDALGSRWSDSYSTQREPLLIQIQKARDSLPPSAGS